MSVEKLPNGKFRAVVRYGGEKRHSPRFTTRHEAKAAYAAILADMKQPKPAVEHTVGQLIRFTFSSAKWSQNTRANYQRAWDAMPAELTRMNVTLLTPPKLERLLEAIPQAWYRKKAHALLGVALGRAARDGLIPTSPTKLVRVPAPEAKEIEVPTKDEVLAIIDAAPESWKVFLHLAATSCARRGELVGLQWKDLKVDSLTIRRSVSESGGRYEVTSGKTGKGGHRTVKLDSETVALLSALPRTSIWMFPNSQGGHRSPVAATRAFARASEKLGLDYSLNSLRHYGATTLLAAGRDVVSVSRRLGHRNPTMTLNVYAHWIPANDEAAAQTLALGRQGAAQS